MGRCFLGGGGVRGYFCPSTVHGRTMVLPIHAPDKKYRYNEPTLDRTSIEPRSIFQVIQGHNSLLPGDLIPSVLPRLEQPQPKQAH